VAHYAFASWLVGQRGGGIGVRVLASADQLSQNHRVTLITDLALREELSEHFAGNANVELIFVPIPDPAPVNGYHGFRHLWSMRVYRALRELCGRDAPDLVQFSDFAGEATVTIQARRTGEPLLTNTMVAVWLASSWEICDVLDNHIPDELEQRALYALERYSLRFADRLVYSADAVLETYKSFYGADALAPALKYPAFATTIDASPNRPVSKPGDPLRLLYVGRLERRKGVIDLVRAAAFHPADDWTLTLCGSDTPSASVGASVRAVLEDAAGGDPRIAFLAPRSHDEVMELIDQHDALVSPSVWESGPNTALEALGRNRPVLATPVGGHFDFAIEGQSGMLAADTGHAALTELLGRAVEGRDALRALTASGAPRRRFEELTDPAALELQFADAARSSAKRASTRQPLVTVVIPYFHMSEHIEATVASVRAQSYPNIETLIVRDGSFGPADATVERLGEDARVRVLAKLNGGVGSARNFGAMHADGEYIVFLDSDNRLHPEFIERAVTALERDPEMAYVTALVALVDPDGSPHQDYRISAMIGNFPEYGEEKNIAGDAMAMVRRSVFDAGHRFDEEIAGHEDRVFYMELRRAGLFGHAIPEPLLDYQVIQGSMLRSLTQDGERRLDREMAARMRQREVAWTT
jgi:glycosyltransferase involved in cell wall biosynthesis